MGGTATPPLNVEDHRRSSRSCWGCYRGSPRLGQRKCSLHEAPRSGWRSIPGQRSPKRGFVCLLFNKSALLGEDSAALSFEGLIYMDIKLVIRTECPPLLSPLRAGQGNWKAAAVLVLKQHKSPGGDGLTMGTLLRYQGGPCLNYLLTKM